MLSPPLPLIGVPGRWVLLSSKADAKEVVSFLGRHEVRIMGRAVHRVRDKIQRILLTAT